MTDCRSLVLILGILKIKAMRGYIQNVHDNYSGHIFDTDSNATITFFQRTAVCKQVADKARRKGRAYTAVDGPAWCGSATSTAVVVVPVHAVPSGAVHVQCACAKLGQLQCALTTADVHAFVHVGRHVVVGG